MRLTVEQALVKGKNHEKKGNLSQARAVYTELLDYFPNNKRVKAALAALKTQKVETARQSAIGSQESIKKLLSLYSAGQTEQVIAEGTRLTLTSTGSFELWSILGAAYKDLGKLDHAEDAFRRALSIKNIPEAHNNLGSTLLKLGKIDHAIAEFERAVIINPSYALGYYNFGCALQEKGKLGEAISKYENAVSANPNFAEAFNKIGLIYKKDGNYEKALLTFERALALKKDYAEAQNNIGAVMNELGDLGEAINAYKTAVCLRPEFAEAHNNIGVALQKLGKLDEAVTSHSLAISLDDKVKEYKHNLARAYQAKGEFDMAIHYFKESLKIDKMYEPSLLELSRTLHKMNLNEEAISSLSALIQINSKHVEAFITLGEIYAKIGDLDSAISSLSRAIRLSGNYPEALEALGNLLLLKNQRDEAKDAYIQALRIRCARSIFDQSSPEDYAKREAGFNPIVFALEHSDSLRACTNPLSEFTRAGCPNGPWLTPVIRGSAEIEDCFLNNNQKVALHIHAHYFELIHEILSAIDFNKAKPDLFISISEEDEKKFYEIFSSYSGRINEIRTFPNRGRDIGPFLTGFGRDLVDHYDIIGHVHTKKSPHLSKREISKNWFSFCIANTLGGVHSGNMMDRIIQKFSEDNNIGIVYPDDPRIPGWGPNYKFAKIIADKIGFSSLPTDFSFPVGNMFWMKASVLKSFVDLDLKWSDYPAEPLPTDGTILHGLERLFGALPHSQGLKTILTNTVGVSVN